MRPLASYLGNHLPKLRSDANEWFEALAYVEHYGSLEILRRFNPSFGYLAGDFRSDRIAKANEIASIEHRFNTLCKTPGWEDKSKLAGQEFYNVLARHWGNRDEGGRKLGFAGLCFREVRVRLTAARAMDAYVETGKLRLDKPDLGPLEQRPKPWNRRSEAVRYLYAACALSMVKEVWKFTVTPDHALSARHRHEGRTAKGGEMGQFKHGFAAAVRRALTAQNVPAGRDDLFLAFAAEGVAKTAGKPVTTPHVHGVILVRRGQENGVRTALRCAAHGPSCSGAAPAVRLEPFTPDKPEGWPLYSGVALSGSVACPGAVFVSQAAGKAGRALYDADRDAFLNKELVPDPTRKYMNPWHPKASRFRL